MKSTAHLLTICLAGGFLVPCALAEDDAAELAKKLSNPVASLISVPFQANWDFNGGQTNDGVQFRLNFQPVVPVNLTDDWKVIVRTIVPYIEQDDVYIADPHQNGLGDVLQTFFFSPRAEMPVTLGFGPAVNYPTATDDLLGTEKWSAGPSLLVLKQNGGWTMGALTNHLWSFAGDEERDSVCATFVQPFLSYQTKTHTTFGVNAECTYDWETSQWTVPLNATVSQMTKLGRLPVQFTVGGRYYVEGPGGAPEWGLRAVITLVLPGGGAKQTLPAPAGKGYSK